MANETSTVFCRLANVIKNIRAVPVCVCLCVYIRLRSVLLSRFSCSIRTLFCESIELRDCLYRCSSVVCGTTRMCAKQQGFVHTIENRLCMHKCMVNKCKRTNHLISNEIRTKNKKSSEIVLQLHMNTLLNGCLGD